MKTTKPILALLFGAMVAHAQLAVTVSPPKVIGQTAVVPLGVCRT